MDGALVGIDDGVSVAASLASSSASSLARAFFSPFSAFLTTPVPNIGFIKGSSVSLLLAVFALVPATGAGLLGVLGSPSVAAALATLALESAIAFLTSSLVFPGATK